MTSVCHASAGTCSAINISLGVIYEYRPEGNALSTEHEKAIVFSRAGHGRRPRQKERDISAYAGLGLALRRASLTPGVPLFHLSRNKRQLFFSTLAPERPFGIGDSAR